MIISSNAVGWLNSSSGLVGAIPVATFSWQVVLEDWNHWDNWCNWDPPLVWFSPSGGLDQDF